MERAGVNFARLSEKLMASETLWKGMFLAHHSNVPDVKRMEIFNALAQTPEGEEPEKDENNEIVDSLMGAVYDEYSDAIEALKRSRGNVSWKRT